MPIQFVFTLGLVALDALLLFRRIRNLRREQRIHDRLLRYCPPRSGD